MGKSRPQLGSCHPTQPHVLVRRLLKAKYQCRMEDNKTWARSRLTLSRDMMNSPFPVPSALEGRYNLLEIPVRNLAPLPLHHSLGREWACSES
jgi:hypothetical protein